MEWTAIVLTCPNSSYTLTYQKGKETVLLAVDDPKCQIGSGGATLNALLVLAEHLSAKKGYSVINTDVLEDCKILVIHSGRPLPYEPCGRPFISLPLTSKNENRNQYQYMHLLDFIINLMSEKVAVNSSSGVWVCSSDMLLTIGDIVGSENFIDSDVLLLMVPSKGVYAKDHGICELDEKGVFLQNIHFKCKQDDVIQRCKISNDLVPLVSGVVYLSLRVANTLLALHTISPLDACTYLGYDSGIMPIQIWILSWLDPLTLEIGPEKTSPININLKIVHFYVASYHNCAKLSLFFDFLLAMCPGYSEEKFVNGGDYSNANNQHDLCGKENQTSSDFTPVARKLVYKHFSKFKCKTVLTQGCHTYLTWNGQEYLTQIIPSSSTFDSSNWEVELRKHSFTKGNITIGERTGLINCAIVGEIQIGSGSLLQNVFLAGKDVEIGKNCIISGITLKNISGLHLSDNLSITGFLIGRHKAKKRCLSVFGCHDNIMSLSTFCNIDFDDFKRRTGICNEDLWDNSEMPKSLYNAKLFPTISCNDHVVMHKLNNQGDFSYYDDIFLDFINLLHGCMKDSMTLERWKNTDRISLKDIFNSNLDIEGLMELKRLVHHEVSCQIIEETLVSNQPLELQHLYEVACADGMNHKMLKQLDEIGYDNHKCPGISARVLANIANLLGKMAGSEGGLRSGPASNQHWIGAFKQLEEGDVIGGLKTLSLERNNWLDSKIRMVRAARHYEGASQVLIRQAVMSAREFIKTKPCDLLEIDQWVTCHCPARIDISGGWSDTPPITYENGGAVFNAAITVNGLKPIGAQARRIPSIELVIHLEGGLKIVGNNLDFMGNYNQPSAAGSLIKACFICSGLVDYPSHVSLKEQLYNKFKSGFEVKSWSDLPHGSGLGTSSIMAGAVLACLWRSAGYAFDLHSLNHAVLYVEQLLTTGGGWQDQVGGLCKGLKLGHSRASLPLKIDVDDVIVTKEVLESFNRHLVLVYTGQTRLAKNLLQNVIRNWYARDEQVVKVIGDLVRMAYLSKEAFQCGDLVQLGWCMDQYWHIKKTLSPGSEPRSVTLMMESLRDRCHGMCMAGAGGGGFMFLLTKNENDDDNIRTILSQMKNKNDVSVYKTCIDEEGMKLQIEGLMPENIPLHI